jgi:hypothetical protein
VRVAPEHGEPRKKPGQGRGDRPFGHGFLLENTYLRISVEYFRSVRGCLDIGGEVFARVVPLHVKAASPQFAGRDIKDFPVVSEIYRLSIFAVELSKVLRGEFFDGLSPPSYNASNIQSQS